MAKRLEQWNPDVGNVPSRWKSRGLLLALLIGLTLLASIIYAGPAFGTVSYRLMFDGGLTLLWLASATGLGLFIARPLLKNLVSIPAALRFVTIAALGLGAMSLALLGLGLIGWLNALTAWGLVGIGLILGIVRIIRLDTPEMRAALNRWFSESAGVDWLWLLLVPTFLVMLVGAMFPPGLLWSPDEPHGYDVVEYHLQVPREWYEAGRIIPLHHNAFSYFPFNVEMHYLLAMHLRGGPWAGMYLAQLMHVTFMALAVLAVYGVARSVIPPSLHPSATPPLHPSIPALLPPAGPAMIAALAMLGVPWITQLAGIAYDEGGFLLFGTLAIGIALLASADPQRRLRRFALAGLMAGFAAGSKLTAVPEVLVAVPVVIGVMALWRMLVPSPLPATSAFESYSGERVRVRGHSPEARNLPSGPSPQPSPPSTGEREQETRPPGRTLRGADWLGVVIFVLFGLACFSPWMLRNMAWAENPVFPE